MKKLLLAIAGISLAGLILTFPIQSNFASRAKMIQRIEKSASGDLFGDEGTPIGEPMMLIIDDGKAFIDPPTSSGTLKVDEKYLTDNKIHPLQLKTVDFLASASRIGFSVATILFGLLGWRWKSKAKTLDGS